MSAIRGAGLVEALFAIALAALATGILAASVFTGSRALALARGTAAQTTATYDGLERLRRGSPGVTDELVGTAPPVTRRSERTPGRGRPDALSVAGSWAALSQSHAFLVRSEHLP